MWSKWQWVIRIASIVRPSSSTGARIRSASSPGSTISARSEPSRRNRKQFSATGPTVNIRTSTSAPLLLAAQPRPLAASPHEVVDEVTGRDVEGEHEGAEGERLSHRATEDRQQQDDEQRRGDQAADR